MRLVETFCGAGDAFIGLHRAGFEHVAAVDFDEAACATLRIAVGDDLFGRAHPAIGHPLRGVVRWGRVEDFDAPVADAWWASPPCQGFSMAGQRLGPLDPRNGFPAMFKALDRAAGDGRAPRWLMIENVTGMLAHKGAGCDATCPRCYFEVVLGELRARFPVVDFRTLNAADFGVPQTRRRVIVVAGPCSIEWPAPTHSESDGGGLLSWVSMRTALNLGPDAAAIGDDECDSMKPQWHRREDPDAPSRTVVGTSEGGGPKPLGLVLRTGHRTTAPDGSRPLHEVAVEEPSPAVRVGNRCGPQLVEIVTDRPEGHRSIRSIEEPSLTVRSAAMSGLSLRSRQEDESPLDERPDWWHRASRSDGPSRTVGSRANASIRENPLLGSVGAPQGYRVEDVEGPASTVIAGGNVDVSGHRGGARAPLVYAAPQPELLDLPAPCVSATEAKGAAMSAAGVRTSQGGLQRASDALQLGAGIRRLTVRECAILQDFPADWPFQGLAEDQYRCVGNAVPSTLAEVVGRAVIAADGGTP